MKQITCYLQWRISNTHGKLRWAPTHTPPDKSLETKRGEASSRPLFIKWEEQWEVLAPSPCHGPLTWRGSKSTVSNTLDSSLLVARSFHRGCLHPCSSVFFYFVLLWISLCGWYSCVSPTSPQLAVLTLQFRVLSYFPACLSPALLCLLSEWVRSGDGPHKPALTSTTSRNPHPHSSLVTSRATSGSWDHTPPLPLTLLCTFDH